MQWKLILERMGATASFSGTVQLEQFITVCSVHLQYLLVSKHIIDFKKTLSFSTETEEINLEIDLINLKEVN